MQFDGTITLGSIISTVAILITFLAMHANHVKNSEKIKLMWRDYEKKHGMNGHHEKE